MSVRPSIPRTPAQVTLRVVSVVMGLLGALVLLGGVLVFVNRDLLGVPADSLWTVFTYGGIILGAAGLLLLTAWLGLRAADDSSRVTPYRNLCYFVGLVLLVAIVWGWGMGMFILFNPVVLASTVTYVIICSQLADKVADEHERGVRGEVFMRTGSQRTLHLMAEVILVKGVIVGVFVGVVAIATAASGSGAAGDLTAARALADQIGLSGENFAPAVAGGLATAAVNVAVGMLGIWGSNRPEKILPFFAWAVAAFAFGLVKVVADVVARGALGTLGIDVLVDLLYTGACVYLAWRIRNQSRVAAEG